MKRESKQSKSKGGRPTIVTLEVVTKLENAFMQGFNVTDACNLADVSRKVYYEYIEKNPKFGDKIERLRRKPYLKCILGINKLIRLGDPATLKWYAERKGKDDGFSLRTETTGKGGKDLQQVVIIKDDIKRSKPKKTKI